MLLITEVITTSNMISPVLRFHKHSYVTFAECLSKWLHMLFCYKQHFYEQTPN